MTIPASHALALAAYLCTMMYRGRHSIVQRHRPGHQEGQMEPLLTEDAAGAEGVITQMDAQPRTDEVPQGVYTHMGLPPDQLAPEATAAAAAPLQAPVPKQQQIATDDARTHLSDFHVAEVGGSSRSAEARSNWQKAGKLVQGANKFAGGRSGAPRTHLPGSVQGIDLKRSPEEWAWLSSQWSGHCSVLCVDFTADKVAMHPNINSAQLSTFLSQPRPAWSKVRWLNLDGLSWQAVQSLALHYDLHPLVVEDVVQFSMIMYGMLLAVAACACSIPQRIKADFYEHLLYISCHLVTLAHHGQGTPEQTLRPILHSAIAAAAAARPTPTPSKLPSTAPAPSAASATATAPATAAQASQHVVHVGMGITDGQVTLTHTPSLRQPSMTTSELAASMVADGQQDTDTGMSNLPPGRRLGRMTSVSAVHAVEMPLPHTTDSPCCSPLRRRSLRRSDSRRPPPPSVNHMQAQKSHTSQHRAAELAELLATGVPVHKQQVSIIVLDSNTIISIFETSGTPVTRPLLQQLRDPGTLARDACDASYLACILLDALADSAYPVVDAYSGVVENYEAGILGRKPRATETKDLHLVQGDLATLRRTLLPTLHLVTGLRTHSVDARSANQMVRSTTPTRAANNGMPASSQAAAQQPNNRRSEPGVNSTAAGAAAPAPTFQLRPLVTRLTKTYLGDVQDHLTSLLDALDSQTEACRDLIDLAFNLIALGTNQAMQTLTVVSVLFLPLTFLAGIYGMNFDVMDELHWTWGYYGWFYGLCAVIVIVFLATMYRLGLMSG